jgi:hypothetical protein
MILRLAVGRRLLCVMAAFVVACIGGACLMLWKSPFRRDALVRRIEHQTGSRVEIGSFDLKWFPAGFVAKDVKLLHPSGATLTIGSITLTASYLGLLRHPRMLDRLEATNVHLRVPPASSQLSFTDQSKSGMAIHHIHIVSSAVDFIPAQSGKPRLQFVVHSLTLNGVGTGGRVQFQVALHNPRPAGEIRFNGELGPVDKVDPLRTPAAGSFVFQHADISIPRAIAGTLGASGKCSGPLRAIACDGTADLPAFQVYGSSNFVHVATRFKATINAGDGDVILNRVVAHFNGTTVVATGRVAHEPEHSGKTTDIETRIEDGRVEDLLVLFTRKPKPSMKGLISISLRFKFPPGPPDFLTRLQANGHYHIGGGYFTDAKTQGPVDRLSASAEGNPSAAHAGTAPRARVNVDGDVSDRNGVAMLRAVDFAAPGINGELAGTFDLHRKAIRFDGAFTTPGKLADTTSGLKALLLKAARPFWHKHNRMMTVPFKITGTASHPVFRLTLRSR